MELFTALAKAGLRLGTTKTETITDAAYTKLTCFDAISSQRGDIVANAATQSISIGSTVRKQYELTVGLNAVFGLTEEISIMPFINGVAYSTNPLSIQGRGTDKPEVLYWTSTLLLDPSDVVDIRAINGDNGSFDAIFTRTTFTISADS